MDRVRTIEELQDKLDGVYDLETVDDCRKIISMLLRTEFDRDVLFKQSQDKLKNLAIMVVNENPQEKDQAREALSKSGKSKRSLMSFMTDMSKEMDSASSITNNQLITAVTDQIWSVFDISSRESSILGEMIERLKKA
jgi:cytochrome c556